MKNNGKSDYTINFVRKALARIGRNADLNNPDAVKQFIANLNVSNGYKKNLCLAYDLFCQYYKIEWEMPTYRQQSKTIDVPTTQKLDMIIAHARKTLGLKLSLSKETGLRPVELCNLKVRDVDFDRRLIRPTTAKHGASRVLKISQSLNTRLLEHLDTKRLDLNDKLFKCNALTYSKYYRVTRNNLAKKLGDPSFKKIRLYDFRHYFATRLYAKTKDILFVKQQMGHKKIETTLIYTQLIHFNEDDEYTCRTAKDVKEATQLIENGFQYVTDIDGLRLFKKRK